MTTAPSTRLDSLTGVRFFAALLVFGFHAVHYANTGELDVFSAGMVGVSLFYLLSGFVMAWTVREGDRPAEFYRRRIARIYPAFIAAWLLSLAILLSRGLFEVWDLLPPTLLQAWFPFEAAYFAGNAVFWSLSCEAFFYLVFPLIHRLVAPRRTRTVIAVGVVAAAVSLGVGFAAIGMTETPFTRWLLIIFPPLRLMEFIVGVTLGILFRRGFRLPWPLWVTVPLAAVAVWGASVAPYSLSRFAVTLVPFVILVASLATSDLAGRWNALRWKPIVELGVWSYCFYLLHAMVLSVLFVAAAKVGLYTESTPAPLVWGLLLIGLAASVTAAWMLHRTVERPFERMLRPRARGPRLDDDAPAIPRTQPR